MTTHEDFKGDKPVFNWSDYQTAKSWREPEPFKITPREGIGMAILGLSFFFGGMMFLVLAFCM